MLASMCMCMCQCELASGMDFSFLFFFFSLSAVNFHSLSKEEAEWANNVLCDKTEI